MWDNTSPRQLTPPAAWRKTALGTLALLALILGAQGLVDAVERNTEARLRDREDRIDYRQWAGDACTPSDASETVIVKYDGTRLRCRIYRNADYGMVPSLVSVAVLEPPL